MPSTTGNYARDQSGSIRNPRLSENAVKMELHCAFDYSKLSRDGFIPEPLRNQAQHFHFPCGQRHANNVFAPTVGHIFSQASWKSPG
jgi:hypothetical protein